MLNINTMHWFASLSLDTLVVYFVSWWVQINFLSVVRRKFGKDAEGTAKGA